MTGPDDSVQTGGGRSPVGTGFLRTVLDRPVLRRPAVRIGLLGLAGAYLLISQPNPVSGPATGFSDAALAATAAATPIPAPDLTASSLERGAARFDALLRTLDVLAAELRYTEGQGELSDARRAEIRTTAARLDSIAARVRLQRAELIQEAVRLHHATHATP